MQLHVLGGSFLIRHVVQRGSLLAGPRQAQRLETILGLLRNLTLLPTSLHLRYPFSLQHEFLSFRSF